MAAKWGSVRLLGSVLTPLGEWLLVWARDVGLWMPTGAGATPTGAGPNADGGGPQRQRGRAPTPTGTGATHAENISLA